MFGKYKKLGLVTFVLGALFIGTFLTPLSAHASAETHDTGITNGLAVSAISLPIPKIIAAAVSPTCETTGDPLTWLLCPIFNSMANMSQWIFNSLLQPFLISAPIGTSPTDSSYKIWNQFRIYGNIVLIFGLLFLVFGQAIGGGLVDAYTVKKMLPRLLVAAVLINLSIYIVALLIDLTNIIGSGIGDLLTAPLKESGAWNFEINGIQGIGVLGVGLLGALLAGGSLLGMLAVVFTGGAGAAVFTGFLVVLPVILGLLATFITLIVRKGLLLFLVLVSPIAFALYCLPNTEQYFRRWWKLLLQTLLVYPIVVITFSIGAILSVTILAANSITPGQLGVSQPGVANTAGTAAALTLGQIIAVIVAFFLQFLPLFAIPFAFKISGGLLGQVNEFMQKGASRVNSLADKRRDIAKRDFMNQVNPQRQRMKNSVNSFGDKSNSRLVKSGSRFLGRRAGGYNIEAVLSAQNAATSKEINDQIQTGDDTEPRALTVNKAWALGQAEGTEWQTVEDDRGRKSREFKTAAGKWVPEAAVDDAHSRWGNDISAQQAALSYEMRKASTEEDLQRIAKVYPTIAMGEGGWGMKKEQATGAWVGSAFENQNQHLEYKNMRMNDNGNAMEMNAGGQKTFVSEIYEKRGSYAMGQMGSNTIEELKKAYDNAALTGDTDTVDKITAISETFMSQYGTAGAGNPIGMTGEGGDIPLINPQGPPSSSSQRQANTAGAGHVAERVRELAVITGAYDRAPSGPYLPGHAPTPNNMEQK